MKIRRLLSVVFTTAALLAAFVGTAPSAQALHPINVTNCDIAGTVNLSTAVHLGGTVTVNTGPPPSATITSTTAVGVYTFVSVVIVCAGTVVIGAATASSTGTYTDHPLLPNPTPLPSFTGTYNTSTFTVTGNSCNGSLSGQRAVAVIVASITANCGPDGLINTSATTQTGTLVLGVAPNPLSLTVNCPVINNNLPTSISVTCDPLVNSIIVAGIVILSGPPGD